MNVKLLLQAIIKISLGIVIMGVLLFVPANSLKYWNAWLLMGLLFIPMLFVGLIMFVKSPELLKKRLNSKEKYDDQKQIIILSGAMFVLGFIVAGLNYKYMWICMPDIVVIISSVIFLIAYILYGEVLRENPYLSRTIEVQEDQKVVDTGMYGIVRHPMYAITILLFLMMPLVLNSIFSLIVFLIYPIIIVKRIKGEEEILEKDLPGYAEYKKKVKYRLIPFIW